MDQPGIGHSKHMGEGTLNGRGGYYGRAGYDGNDHGGDGYESSGHGNGVSGQASNGHDGHPDRTADYPVGVRLPKARKPAESPLAADIEAAPDSSTRSITVTVGVPQGATRRGSSAHDDGNSRDDDPPAGTAAPADEAMDAQDPVAQDLDGQAPDGLDPDGQDRDGQAPDGEAPADATDAPGSGASTADRIRELLARSTADHAAIERATAAALDDIRLRLATLELKVAEVREYAVSGQDVADQLAPQDQRLTGMSATLDGLTAGLSTFSAQLSAIDGRLANFDGRLAGTEASLASNEGRVIALDTRFERLDERLDDQYERVTSIDNQLAVTDSRVTMLGHQFAESMTPLAEELRARPARAEVEEIVAKFVYAAHGDLSTRMSSLEDTVLTLAEALLRPAPGHAPVPQGF